MTTSASLLERFGPDNSVHVSLPRPHVLSVELNRVKRHNAFDVGMWDEVSAVQINPFCIHSLRALQIRECFEMIKDDEEVRVVVVSGAGKSFTSGIDLASPFPAATETEVARRAIEILHIGTSWQASFDAIEKCGKPVICCVHGNCIGAGLEMICACDIRFCTAGAKFVLKEVDVGLASDVGGLQRLPKIVGNDSLMRELAFSARPLDAEEAKSFGLVSRVSSTKEECLSAAMELAVQIAAKSPVATLGVKSLLNYSRDHTVADSLQFAIVWNTAMLQGKDMVESMMAVMEKRAPVFDTLPSPKKFPGSHTGSKSRL